MCFLFGKSSYENVAGSPIFKQKNIQSTNNLHDNSFSLSKMRSEIHKLKPEDLEETIFEKPTTHPGTNGPNETPIGDQRGVSTFISTNETYRILLGISQTMFTSKQFEYLIETMQLCHFKDEQWNNLKAILIDHKDEFTDVQWKKVFHLLSKNRLNDKQFGTLGICLTLQHRNRYYCMQVEEQEKLLSHVKSLRSWPGEMKFVIARVQLGLVHCTYHKAKLSIVFSGHGHQV